MHDDLSLLTTALGLAPTHRAALEARLPAAGGVLGLWHAGPEVLGSALPARARRRLDAWIDLTERLLDTRPPPARMETAADVARYFRARLALRSVESFWALMLDARGGVLAMHLVAQGTLTACVVHPREVFAPALRARAAHVVLVHNHPSGDPEPSPEDVSITETLTDAGLLMGIPIVDHVIVARAGFRSIGVPQGGRAAAIGPWALFSPGDAACEYPQESCADELLVPPSRRRSPRRSPRSPRSPRRAKARATSTS